MPQREEIQPQPKTRFAYGKTAPTSPPSRQSVATQKYVFRLPKRARNRMINITIRGITEVTIGIQTNVRSDKW
ncbi:hypothetical protein GCM10027565_44720 [Bordetella tumulicola]